MIVSRSPNDSARAFGLIETVMTLAVAGILLVPLLQLLASGLTRAQSLNLEKEAETLWPTVLLRLQSVDRARLLHALRAKEARVFCYQFVGKAEVNRLGLRSRVSKSASDSEKGKGAIVPSARVAFGEDVRIARDEVKALHGAFYVVDLHWSPLNEQEHPPAGLGLLGEPHIVLEAAVRRSSLRALSDDNHHESTRPIFTRVFSLER